MPDAEKPALRIEGAASRILRRGLATRLGGLSLGLLILTLGAAAFIPPLPSGIAGELVGKLITGGLLLAPVLALAAIFVYLVSWRRPGAVGVGDGHLLLGRHTRIPLSELSEGGLYPDNEVEILRRGGDLVRIRFDRQTDAERLLAAAGLEASQRTLRMTLGETDFLDYLSVLVGAPVACSVVTALARVLGLGPISGIVAVVALSAFVFSAMREVFGPARITIGADGVVIARLFRERFYPHDRIADLEVAPQEVTLILTDGSRVAAKARHLPEAQQKALQIRFEQARRVWSAGDAGGAALSRLDRNGRSGADWREALRAVLAKAAVYRGRALTREDLLAVLESPSAPADRRIGAAVALADAGDADDRTRIRVAADACADPRLRVALEHAAEGSLDDAALEEAAADEARERETVTSRDRRRP